MESFARNVRHCAVPQERDRENVALLDPQGSCRRVRRIQNDSRALEQARGKKNGSCIEGHRSVAIRGASFDPNAIIRGGDPINQNIRDVPHLTSTDHTCKLRRCREDRVVRTSVQTQPAVLAALACIVIGRANGQFGIVETNSLRFKPAPMMFEVVVHRLRLDAALQRCLRRANQFPDLRVMAVELWKAHGPMAKFRLRPRLNDSSPHVTETALRERAENGRTMELCGGDQIHVAIAETLAGVLHCHLVIGRLDMHLAGVGIALVRRFSFAAHLALGAIHLPRDRVPFDFDVAERAR